MTLQSAPPPVQVSKGRRVTINNIIHSVAIVNDIKKWKTTLKTKLKDDINKMEDVLKKWKATSTKIKDLKKNKPYLAVT